VDSQLESSILDSKVLAIQTTRVSPTEINSNENFPYENFPYENFNLGLHVGDCANKVKHNRQCLQNLLPVKTRIQWIEQVHGNTVAEIFKVTKETIIADAMVTREKNIALAIMTADCLPILLISKKGDEIAAIHGGWRSLIGKIIANTIKKMHTAPDDIYAWLGPCIGKEAFEVGSEVEKVFVEQKSAFSQAFIKQENGKFLASLHKIATLQLNDLDIKHISTLSECTYSQSEKYYSYRKNAITGRMATVIGLI
jgi:YfiH family protein